MCDRGGCSWPTDAGFGRAIEAIFAQFGTNIMGVFPGTTSEQAGGQEGRRPGEIPDRRRRSHPEHRTGLLHVAPRYPRTSTVQNDTHSTEYTWSVNGSYPAIEDIPAKLALDYGRFFTTRIWSSATMCGDRFGSQDPSSIRVVYPMDRDPVKGVSFTCSSAVCSPRCKRVMTISTGWSTYRLTTMSDVKDTKYLDGIWFQLSGQLSNHQNRPCGGRLGAAHGFPPSDHNAVFVANLMEQLSQFRIISTGLQVFDAASLER